MRTIRTSRRQLVLGAAALAVTATVAACSSGGEEPMGEEEPMEEDEPVGEEEPMDEAAEVAGDFAGAGGKAAAGHVAIGGDMLTLSGFSCDEGPDLHLYLAAGDDSAAVEAGMELGEVAFDEEDQTFALGGADVSMYDHVIVHCDKARAVFGAAPIS